VKFVIRNIKFFTFCLVVLLFVSQNSFSYVGPGMAGGVIAATIGVVVAIIVAVFGLLWFSLKRFFKNRKEKKNKKDNE